VRWEPVPGPQGPKSSVRVKSCHIVPSLEARHGGPSKSVLGLATALAKFGDTVELLTTDSTAAWNRTDGRLHIQAYRRGWPTSVCASSGLRKHLRAIEVDVVHHHSIWLRTLHYAHQAARRTGASLVVSPRGMMDPWAWRHHSRRKAFARAFVHPRAFEEVDGWHATSKEEAESLASLGFKQPVCVAPNGVAPPTDEESATARTHWRQVLGPIGEKPIALFYSRFHQKKRLLELIDTWLDLAPEDWLLLLVGIPEDYTPRMIEDYVLRSGHAGRVRAYDGAGHPAPYSVASLFLLPSHGENFGLSIAESLANGVPVLVTDTTPWTGLNRNGAGWCVPWSDYGTALRKALSEGPEALRFRGNIGREWVIRDFSWAASARLLADFYSALRAGSGIRRS
jgi:glycosyltransferase involved in cell wall biosynthesis